MQFRALQEKKYLTWYPKSPHPEAFGLDQAALTLWKRKSVILTEGVFDLFPLERLVPGVVATLTAGLSPSLLRALKRWVTTIYLCWDNDAAGKRATRACKDFDFKDISIQEKFKDIGDMWVSGGDDLVGSFLKSRNLDLSVRD